MYDGRYRIEVGSCRPHVVPIPMLLKASLGELGGDERMPTGVPHARLGRTATSDCVEDCNRSGDPALRTVTAACRRPVQGDKVLMQIVYPNANSTEIRSRLALRSTVRGANNRLDMLSIVSYDRIDGTASSLAGARRGTQQCAVTVVQPCSPRVNTTVSIY